MDVAGSRAGSWHNGPLSKSQENPGLQHSCTELPGHSRDGGRSDGGGSNGIRDGGDGDGDNSVRQSASECVRVRQSASECVSGASQSAPKEPFKTLVEKD